MYKYGVKNINIYNDKINYSCIINKFTFNYTFDDLTIKMDKYAMDYFIKQFMLKIIKHNILY